MRINTVLYTGVSGSFNTDADPDPGHEYTKDILFYFLFSLIYILNH